MRLVPAVLGFVAAAAVTLAGTAAGAYAPAEQPGVQTPAAARPLKVVVSIAPLRGLVQPLLPGGSTVDMLIPPGVSEHGYEIPPAKLAAITQADLVVTVGLGLEPQIDKFLKNNPSEGRLAVSMAELLDVKLDPNDHAAHAHGPNGECLHGAVDPHVWLDPGMVKKFVEKLAPKLAERFPVVGGGMGSAGGDGTEEDPMLAAAKRLTARIDEIDAAYRAATDNAETRTLVVGHDAYGWLARRYSLSTIPIAGLNAQEPTNKAVQAAIAAIRQRGAKAVFVEPQLSQAAGKRIAERTKVPVLLLDPLGDGDWFRMMEANLESLKKGLGQKDAKKSE
jgi:zinc transport system substrate-binding protein